MAEAARKDTRVAPPRAVPDVIDLESEINDLADLASLLSDSAEKWIDVPVGSKCAKAHFESIPEGERKALMFGIYKLAQMSRDLAQKYYAATNSEEAAHAEA
jgi:hypothetical protein